MAKGQARGTAEAITAARFSLTVDGVEIAQFSELVSITSQAEPDDLTGKLLKKLPGKRNPPTVTLRRALTTDVELANWHAAAVEVNTAQARKNADLTIYAADGSPVARYYLENAWPSKLEIGALKAGSAEVLNETVTLTSETAQRIAV
jgi:phage tail-like protein